MIFLKNRRTGSCTHEKTHIPCTCCRPKEFTMATGEWGSSMQSEADTGVCEQITIACTHTHISTQEGMHKYTSGLGGINSQLQHQLPVSEQHAFLLFCLFICELQPSGRLWGRRGKPNQKCQKLFLKWPLEAGTKSESPKFKCSALEQKEYKFTAWYQRLLFRSHHAQVYDPHKYYCME